MAYPSPAAFSRSAADPSVQRRCLPGPEVGRLLALTQLPPARLSEQPVAVLPLLHGLRKGWPVFSASAISFGAGVSQNEVSRRPHLVDAAHIGGVRCGGDNLRVLREDPV